MSNTEPMCPPWSTVVEALEARGLLEPITNIVRSHRVTVFEACGRGQTKAVTAARHHAWAYLRATCKFSYPEIARIWGVHHATVHAALKAR